MLCSLLLLTSIGIAKAYLSSYSYAEWGGFSITLDGKWTSTTEWAGAPWMDLSPKAQMRGVVDITGPTYQYNLIEFFTDTTNDPNDYWQICLANVGEPGPNAPDSTCYRIELVGHTTVKVYQGNGTGWTLLSSPPAGFTIKDALSTSPLSSTPHWTCEFQWNKDALTGIIPPLGIRVACYDASNSAAGEQAWPPNTVSSVNNPSQWGSISGYAGDIPEGVSFGAVLLLSFLAVIVGSYYLRKRPGIAAKGFARLQE